MDELSQALLDISEDMIGVFGYDWRPHKLNAIWSQVLGWSTDELYTFDFRDLLHPEDLASVDRLRQTNPDNAKETRRVCLRYRCKDGTYKHLSWNFQAHPQFVVGTARDITRQMMYDDVIRTTNQAARVGIWNVNMPSEVGYWSPEIYDIYDLDPKKETLTLNACARFFSDEDNELIASSFSKLLKDGTGYDLEVTVISAKGRRLPVRIMGAALKENGVVTRAFGVVQDISMIKEGDRALRYQQRLLNGLLDASPSIFYVKDVEGKYIMVNRRFEELFKSSRDQLVGRTDFDLFEKKDALRHIRKDQEVMRTKTPQTSQDDILVEQGVMRNFLSEKFPILDDLGKVVAVAGVATDITELHNYQVELLKAKDLAEAGTRAKSEFLTNMSHEIRTPMNSIIGMADILLDSNLDEEQKKIMLIMSRAAETLMQIINDILDLSKIEAGVMNFEHIPFSVREVVKRSIELLMVKAVEKKLSLDFEIMPDVPEKTVGDFMKVQQVLINLIANGLKFTSYGGVKVVVSLERADGKTQTRFAVRDTGIGLDPDNRKSIFARFAQADSSITRKFGGTGLGLSISQELVVRMGGTIGVESQLGQGSEFYFTLPC